ncbi:ArsR family transcriptional regulator [Actinocorallia longicatena]|uniref:ArsR family transcriptional regulator n=1 Tax=Actinocorallia longicatena TaxID=111803 RepID=A0ABP6QGV2_9ACTN
MRLAAHPLRWRLLTGLAGGDLRVRELVKLTGEPQNLVSYHLRLLRQGGLVTAQRSSFDARDSYYHLDLDRCAEGIGGVGDALHPSLGREPRPLVPSRRKVLFVCTGNSARSPIAEALLRHRTDDRIEVSSAGTRPKPEIHPGAIQILRSRGLDIGAQRPRHLDTKLGHGFDHVITLCDKAREACPAFDDARQVHWSLADPTQADDLRQAFRRTVTTIDTRIRHLLPVLAQESP